MPLPHKRPPPPPPKPPRDRAHSEKEVRGLYRNENELEEGQETGNPTANYHLEDYNEYKNPLAE